MAYIESDTALPGHHKTKRAAKLLKCRRSEIIGCLHCIWAWALTNAPTGDLTGFTAEEIAEESDWEGDPDEFVKALIECGKQNLDGTRGSGFLEYTADGRLIIHHWYEHGGGKLIISRREEAYRKWLGRNNLPDTDANYEAWKNKTTRPRSEATTGTSTPAESTPVPNVPQTSLDISGNLPMSSHSVPGNPVIEQHSVAKRSVTEHNKPQRSVEEQQHTDVGGNDVDVSSQSERGFDVSSPIVLPVGCDGGLVAELIEKLSIGRNEAIRLARETPEECHRQIAHEPYYKGSYKEGKGAYWRSAIMNGYDPPKGYTDTQERKAEGEKRTTQDELTRRQRTEAEERRIREETQYKALLESIQAVPDQWSKVEEEARSLLGPVLIAKWDQNADSPSIRASFNNRVREIISRDYSAQNNSTPP